MLLPQECRGMSKIRHLKVYWRTEPAPSFVAEIIGRCNGACINGVLYKETDIAILPESEVSRISVGQSCYMFFSPARRSAILAVHPSCSADEELDVSRPSPILQSLEDPSTRRFPKLWSKALVDVFQSVGKNELTQSELVSEFIRIHAVSVAIYMGSTGREVEEELWSRDLKRFVTKAPFDFDPVNHIISFDPSAVKPRRKVPRIGVPDGSDGDNNI